MEPQVASEPALFRAELDAELPAVVERGRGTALVVRGRCSAGAEELRLRFAEVETEVWVAGLEAPEPGLEGWSAVLPIPTGVGYGTHELALVGTLGGGEVGAPIGEIEIVARDPVRRPAPASWPIATGDPLVVVCMATREPEPGHLRRQIDSVKAQEGANWICVVSDDASSSEGGRAISDAIAGDPRFIVSRSPSRLGFLGNFERALRMAPVEAGYCALADQDDLWRPDKLATMVAALEADPTARLAFSDFRLVTGEGVVLSDTFWTARRPRSSDLASLLVANQVTGAAALFRRELLEPALPFPPDPGGLYHDHWLALCALVSGGIRYVPRVTYDHLRYDDSVTVSAQRRTATELPPGRARQAVARARGLAGRLRGANRGAGKQGFERYLMLLQLLQVLELRLGSRIDPSHRRIIERFRAAADPSGAAWLALRGLRPWIGRNETMGREHFLLGGLQWARTSQRRARRSRRAAGDAQVS